MKSKISIILLPFLFLFSGCAYYNTFYNATKFYKDAEKERKKREKTQVVELSAEEEEQLKKTGRSGADEQNRAGQQEMQKYQQAIERASRVLEYFPESRWVDDALILLGKCFYYRRDFKKADRKFDELMQLYPNSDFVPEARLLKARTFIGMENYDIAEQQLTDLADDENVPKRVREQAKYELGGLYLQKQNFVKAAENFRSSSRSADDKLIQAMSLYRLGDCLIRLKQYEEAPEVFRKAIKEAPNEDFNSQAMFKLAQAYSLSGDYDRAIKTFRSLLSKEFEEKRIPRIKLELAENLRQKGDLAEALKWYDEIIELHKRTDASARAYYALAEVEEFIRSDYKKAKENYDLVRSEFSSSLIAPRAQERSNNIRTLLELRNDIARLEGKAVDTDSTSEAGGNGKEDVRDDGPIEMSMDGMWVNYIGRDRPPPITLTDLTESDRLRQEAAKAKELESAALGDSTATDSTKLAAVQVDSTQLAKQAEEEKLKKEKELSGKFLSLAEVLMFSFNLPDSAIKYYQVVVDRHVDSTQTARALYSLSYIYKEVLKDTSLSKLVLQNIVELFPDTQHAEGARKILGLPLNADRVDSAAVLFQQAENEIFEHQNYTLAFAIFDSVQKTFPTSDFAQKAAYAKAWYYETSLFRLEEAVAAYESLVVRYPDSPLINKVKPKLAAVDQVRKQKEAKEKAIADSLAKIEQVEKDKLAAAAKAETTVEDSTSGDLKPPAEGTLNGAGEQSNLTLTKDSTKTNEAAPPQSRQNAPNVVEGDSSTTVTDSLKETSSPAQPPAENGVNSSQDSSSSAQPEKNKALRTPTQNQPGTTNNKIK
ncbi:MAG: tetratricopeptide repeat protein [Calditrichaeota bacterium]|nr:MAG: tetratricopeptide repeat protein [Calditrichota bacterium]